MSELAPDPAHTAADRRFCQQVLAVLTAALSDPAFTPARLAAALGVPERTLYRRFRALLGTTPGAYLRTLRLARARQLLEAHQVTSVAEVTFAVGFEDTAYFARVFYQQYGCRVSDYLTDTADPDRSAA